MVGLKAFNKSGGGLDPGLAKRGALFPEGRGLGGGGRKSKREKVREKEKGAGRAPADLHPPLNKTKVAKAVVEVRNPG